MPPQPEADAAPHEHRYQEPDQAASTAAATTTFDRLDSECSASVGPTTGTSNEDATSATPEDLRMKMDTSERPVQEEPLSSTVGTGRDGGGGGNASANGTTVPTQITYEPDKSSEIISASMWNSVQGKLGKTGAVTTPDGN